MDCYTIVYPILKKYNLTATFFVPTGFIDTGKLPWFFKVWHIVNRTQIENFTVEAPYPRQYSVKDDAQRASVACEIVKNFKQLSFSQCETAIDKLAEMCHVDCRSSVGERLFLSWDEIIEMSKNGMEFGSHQANIS